MAPKNRKIAKNLGDEFAEVLMDCEYSLPFTKNMLKEKPHFSATKNEFIPGAVKELKDLYSVLAESLIRGDGEADKQQTDSLIMSALCQFVISVLQFDEYFDLVYVESLVNQQLFLLTCEHIPTRVKHHVSLLCERFVEISVLDHHTQVSQFLISYLLDLTSPTKSVKKVDIKRIWALHNVIDALRPDVPEWEDIIEKYMSTVTNEHFVHCREGQHVIAYLMRKDVDFAKRIHDLIMKKLPRCSKSVASGYGLVYFVAWNYAEVEEIKKTIELFIQEMIRGMMATERCGVELPRSGANTLAFLSALHGCRNQKNFSHTLSTLYEPILYRTLRDHDPWRRCNGAQVFFDLFPLENPFSSSADKALHLEKQIKEMKDLLVDQSHFVRIISIRGVCMTLSCVLPVFTVSQASQLLAILTKLAQQDVSTYLVRKAVFEGFEVMLGERGSALLLEDVLRKMRLSFYDDNWKVRKAYVKVLLKVHEKQEWFGHLRFHSLNSIEEIIDQLAVEGPGVGGLLAKLLIGQIIGKNIVNRLCKLIKFNYKGVQNLFQYSHRAMSVNDAYRLIVSLVGTVRKLLKDYLDSMAVDQSACQSTRRKRKLRTNDDESESNQESPSNSDEEGEDAENNPSLANSMQPPPPGETTPSSKPTKGKSPEEFLNEPLYISGLLHVSVIVWSVFRKEISDNAEYLTNLYNLASNSIPMFLRYYKDTIAYYATVHLASLIPIAKLKPVSTVSSACISELKKVTPETETYKLETLIQALCAWNLGRDVLDLATDWLNFAFREENLNNTAVQRRSGQKVRFFQNNGKPLLALRLLDVLFSDAVCEQRIINKSYDQLHDFYYFLERILVIIERRLAGEIRTSVHHLTDEFLLGAFARYLRIQQSLSREAKEGEQATVGFSTAQASLATIQWAQEKVLPKIPEKEPRGGGGGEARDEDEAPAAPLPAQLCLTLLREASLCVQLGETSREHCLALCLFAMDLLNFECSWFIEEVFLAIKAVSDYSSFFNNYDEWKLTSGVLPQLFEKALSALAKLDVTATTVKPLFKNLLKFKSALFCLPEALLRLGKRATPGNFKDVYSQLVRACVTLLVPEIIYEENVVKHSKVEELPYFASVIMKTLIIKSYFVVCLLSSITDLLKEFSKNQESEYILSCVSLLYTVGAVSGKRLDQLKLEAALQTAFNILQEYKPMEQPERTDSFSDATPIIDVGKIGQSVLIELGKLTNCAIFTGSVLRSSTPITWNSTSRLSALRSGQPEEDGDKEGGWSEAEEVTGGGGDAGDKAEAGDMVEAGNMAETGDMAEAGDVAEAEGETSQQADQAEEMEVASEDGALSS